jgi:leucyl-tRNA synthetase
MMPHLAEEIHQRLEPQSTRFVAEMDWPTADVSLLTRTTVTIAVQVMGRLRGTIDVAPGSDRATVIAKARDDVNVKQFIGNRTIAREIYVPDRIVNFVLQA